MKKIHLINFKRKVEGVLMHPFVLLGRLIAILNPLDKEYDFFMFFPSYCIGGAEKINADIVSALPDKQIIIFFTKYSPDDKLLHMFKKSNVKIVEINKWTDNKLIYWGSFIYRGICSYHINKQKQTPVVFNGQCNFGYKLLPHINPEILKVELIHNSYLQFAKITFPYVEFIDRRVMYVDEIIEQHKFYYKDIGLNKNFGERIVKIINCIDVPENYTPKKNSGKLKVYYAGRGGYQKRLELLFEIFRICIKEKHEMEFHLAGTFENEIPDDIKPHVIWHGGISGQKEMFDFHKKMDVLIMTSRFEGFPVAIAEAMCCGVAIVATAVNGIPEHITEYKNGFLMKSKNESEIIADALTYLTLLSQNGELLAQISQNNYLYAQNHFSVDKFVKEYRTRAFNLPY